MAVKVKHHKGKWWVFIDHHGKEEVALVVRVDSLKTFKRKRLPITVRLVAWCSEQGTWVVAVAFRMVDDPHNPMEGDAYINPRQDEDFSLLQRLTKQARFPLFFLSPDLERYIGKAVSWSEQQRQEVGRVVELVEKGAVGKIGGSFDPDFEQAKREFQARYTVRNLLEIKEV